MEIELINIIGIIILSIVSSIDDIKNGIVKNKILLYFFIGAIVLNLLNFIFVDKTKCFSYLINLIIIITFSLILYFSHSIAGGDCKLIIVLAFLYPPRCYIIYNSTEITLLLCVLFAFALGLLYIVLLSSVHLIQRKNRISKKYITTYLKRYITNFIVASSFVSLGCYIVKYVEKYGVFIKAWLSSCIFISIAWLVGKNEKIKKIYILIPVIVLDIIIGYKMSYIPISTDMKHYILIGAVLLCQLISGTNLYEKMEVDELKEKMILSTLSSITMQNSNIRGLPPISSEDLRDRLTYKQVQRIKEWARRNEVGYVYVVRKIPFAIFICAGFVLYFVFWGVLYGVNV